MAFKVELDGGKYMFVNDNGIVDFYRYGEPSDAFLGSKPILALLHKLEQQERLLSAYRGFEGDVGYAAGKVSNSRLDDALEELSEEKRKIEEEFE